MLRAIDICLAILALVVLSPLFLLTMIVLRMTGEGEVFFVQQRVGKSGRMFGLIKFATMLKNSESIGTGTVTIKNDPRILPVGAVLRKTKINELPQLFNILFGHMSVIGPRPQDRRCFDAFPENMRVVITSVPPGLSGIGSIVFRNEEEIIDCATDPDYLYDNLIMPYKAEVEEWFVQNRGLKLYFELILATIFVVLMPRSLKLWNYYHDLPSPPSRLMNLLGYHH